MDLLDRYQQQKNPEAEQKVVYAPIFDDGSLEGGGAIIKFLVKISGGRIQSMQSANVALAVVAIALFALAFYLFFGGGDTRPSISSSDLRLTPSSSFPQR